MNIYAAKGYKVMVTPKSINNGSLEDIKSIVDQLEIGKIYLVERTEVSSWSTKVYLQGIDYPFNSVNFEEIEPQDDETTKEHKYLKGYLKLL